MTEPLYVWITRWEDFQHYKPERDRAPAWIKDYTKQLDDERYLDLTDRRRALLRDLRDIFAIAHGRVRYDARTIARRRNCHTRDADLEALNHAGLIEAVSRETLDQRLDQLYSNSRPHTRPRARREGEAFGLEGDTPKSPAEPGTENVASDNGPTNPRTLGTNPRAHGTNPRAIQRTEGLRAWINRVKDDYTRPAILEELTKAYRLDPTTAAALLDQELAAQPKPGPQPEPAGHDHDIPF